MTDEKNKDANDLHLTPEEVQKLEEEAFTESNIIDFHKAAENLDPQLKIINDLNAKHIFVADLGGKSAVTNFTYNEVTGKLEMGFLPLDTFKNKYMHITVDIGTPRNPKPITIGELWLKDGRKIKVDSITYDPSSTERIIESDGNRYLNMWEGYSVRPTKGSWRKTQRHIYRVLCNSDPRKFKYVYKWLAWGFQNPHRQAEVALVFKGEKGTGKTFMFEQIKRIYGKHGMVLSDPSRLVGQYSEHMRALSFLFCDEVYYPGDKKIEGRIKALITNDSIDIEGKFKDAMTMKNRLHIVMATNNEWIVPATKDERRYFIEKINNMYSRSNASDPIRKKYFDALWGEMDRGGREAMLYSMLNYNLHGWHPRDSVPETRELQEQREMNLNALLGAFKDIIEDGVLPGEEKHGEWHVPADALYTHLEKIDVNCAKFSSVRKANVIKKLGAKKSRIPGVGRNKWIFPPLKEVRRLWDKEICPIAWDGQDKWVTIKTDY